MIKNRKVLILLLAIVLISLSSCKGGNPKGKDSQAGVPSIETVEDVCGYSDEVSPVSVDDLYSLVQSLRIPFNQTLSMIWLSPGLTTEVTTLILDANGTITGEGATQYGEDIYLATNDPHIRTLQDIVEKIERLFTSELLDEMLNRVLYSETPPYREIDGVLHKLLADGPDVWFWDEGDVIIKDATLTSFVAIVPLGRVDEEGCDSLKLLFSLDSDWKIADVV